MANKIPSGPRSIALVGPYSSGKTSLLENMLLAAGAISRKGTVKEGNMVGDGSPEAQSRQMSVEISAATFDHMGELLTVLDCPGSLEFLQESCNAMIGVDAAVVVCEPDLDRVGATMPLLRFLGERKIPHMIFVNKLDRASTSVADFVSALGGVSQQPLVLRQVPIGDDESVTGYVDLLRECAYRYTDDGESEPIEIPAGMADEVARARTDLLEALADFDDTLLEKLLEDEIPPVGEVFANLHDAFQQGLFAPVLFGAAERQSGVRRLLKALRHDVPEAAASAARVGLDQGGDVVVQVLKTYHTASSGKLSLARVWRGTLKDGSTLKGRRVASLSRMLGQATTKVPEAAAGEIVALGRMDAVQTGDLLSSGAEVAAPDAIKMEAIRPVYALAVKAENRADEVKLSDALHKLADEDPSLIVESNLETHQMMLWGQGEIHLQVALERARNKYNLPLHTERPTVPYKETVRKTATRVQGRHKKQSGGHGQFGDVFLDIKPLPRGSGIQFSDKISGGVVPKQYIPAVAHGVQDYCKRGPLGFPVVDVAVTLVFGSFHAVDSSEMAFQTAGRIAMGAAMPQCRPVLLEPIFHVDVHIPNEFTAHIQRLLSGRRGQILGFEARAGWHGWDTVSAQVPQSELPDLIIELRSLTRGVGTYDNRFDHLQELSGKLADDVVAAAAEAAQ
ncbi:MAG: elongation factor G [Alphaproteobacteria bacterium]|nr:elongation factor G [Alphaproteobacteria bacterium]MDP6515346.1 elongation factor G [Alphaproteobacteria bacterium]